MDKFEYQTQLLNNLCQIMYNNAPENCEEIGCEFLYRHGFEDGSYSVGHEFWYVKNGVNNSKYLNDSNRAICDIIPKLHASMKDHTGGDWTSFVLKMDKSLRATTKFHYPEQDSDK